MSDKLSDSDVQRLLNDRAKEKAKQRLAQLNSGDLTHGLAGKTKQNLSNNDPGPIQEDYSFMAKPKPEKPGPKIKEPKQKVAEPKISNKTNEKLASKGDMIIANNTGRVRRNRLIIVMLLIIILLIWAAIGINYVITKRQVVETNCYTYFKNNSTSDCTLLLNNEKRSEWMSPSDIGAGKIYKDIKLELDIKQAGIYVVRVKVEVFKKDVKIEDFGLIGEQSKYTNVTKPDGSVWLERKNVNGGSKFTVLNQIQFYTTNTNKELVGLDVSNITIKIYIEIENQT